MTKLPARIRVILAREAEFAMVLRRGPSRSVCAIGWDRSNDEFTVGQWLRGQIDDRLSDLSPDGRHFIYFAANGKDKGEVKGSWTAISKTPYLKAIGLWSGILWKGGGLFATNSDYLLGASPNHCGSLIRELRSPDGFTELNWSSYGEWDGKSCLSDVRLLRDGWMKVDSDLDDVAADTTVFRKPLPLGWILEKIENRSLTRLEGKEYPYDGHRLINPARHIVLDFPDWEWADLDKDRLVWSESGKLFAATIMKDGPDFIKELYDFNDLVFKPIRAPY